MRKTEYGSLTRGWLATVILSTVAVLATQEGCISPWFAKRDPAEEKRQKREEIREVLQSKDRPRLIREVAILRMPTLNRLENIALVNNLAGTGGIAKPSAQRDKLLDEMRRHDVAAANQVLDDPTTAMVTAEVIVPPAAMKMDRLEVLVNLSKHAEGTDLQGGWLMFTTLAEANVLGGRVVEGFDTATAQGPVVTKAQSTGSDDPADKLVAIVVGGGVLMKDRKIGIEIRSEFADAITMATIWPAVNRRFTHFNGQNHLGSSTPRTAKFIELQSPHEYRWDPVHFMNVVMSIGFTDTQTQQFERIEQCRQMLQDPTMARDAAWQLEAIGKPAVDTLASVIDHANPEIRFYVAHALAYLNDLRAVTALRDLASTEPAFRAMCYNGLTILKYFEAREALVSLLHDEDVEVRYGAVIALRRRDAGDPDVTGNKIEDVGSVLEIPSDAAPAIAVSLTRVPEVVIFGDNPKVTLAAFEYVNPHLMLRSLAHGRVAVSRFSPGEQDQIVEVASDLRSILLGIAKVGGSYGDWVAFLSKCQRSGLVDAKVAINPVPTAGRVYHREQGAAADASSTPELQVNGGEASQSINSVAGSSAGRADSADTREQSTWLQSIGWRK